MYYVREEIDGKRKPLKNLLEELKLGGISIMPQ